MSDDPTALTLARPRELLDTVSAIARRRGRRKGLSESEVDDVTQTVLTAYAAHRASGRRPDNVAAYLETSTRHAIADLVDVAERRRTVAVDPLAGGGEDPVVMVLQLVRSSECASVTPAQQQLAREVWALATTADAHLLRRRFVDRLSAAEVAAELGITPAAVDQRVRRARGRWQVALEDRPDLLAELRAGHPQVYAVDQRRDR